MRESISWNFEYGRGMNPVPVAQYKRTFFLVVWGAIPPNLCNTIVYSDRCVRPCIPPTLKSCFGTVYSMKITGLHCTCCLLK